MPGENYSLFSLFLVYVLPHKSFIIIYYSYHLKSWQEKGTFCLQHSSRAELKVSRTAMQTTNLHPRENTEWGERRQVVETEYTEHGGRTKAFTPDAHGHSHLQHKLRPLGYDHCLWPQKLLTRNTQQASGQNCSLQRPVHSQTLLLTSSQEALAPMFQQKGTFPMTACFIYS